MNSSNSIDVAAPAQTIFELAEAVERWPQMLPHYRFVHVLARNGARRTLEMGAWRDCIPIRWVAETWSDEAAPRLYFHHVAGWTKGMDVEWVFRPIAGGTRVTIEHRLRFDFPVAAEFLGTNVVGHFFVENVAAKTLARMKVLAEAQR